MTLENKIQPDLKAAMLSRNEPALRALRAIKSAVLLAKTSGSSGEIKEDDEIKLLQKLLKQRKEAFEIFEKEGRHDLSKAEKEEIDIIEKYLPVQMNEEEIKAEIKKIIEQAGAKDQKEFGKIMGIASKHFAGKADNKMVAAVVKMLLLQN